MPSTLPNMRSATDRSRKIANDLRAFVDDGMDPELGAKLLAVAEELDSIHRREHLPDPGQAG